MLGLELDTACTCVVPTTTWRTAFCPLTPWIELAIHLCRWLSARPCDHFRSCASIPASPGELSDVLLGKLLRQRVGSAILHVPLRPLTKDTRLIPLASDAHDLAARLCLFPDSLTGLCATARGAVIVWHARAAAKTGAAADSRPFRPAAPSTNDWNANVALRLHTRLPLLLVAHARLRWHRLVCRCCCWCSRCGRERA